MFKRTLLIFSLLVSLLAAGCGPAAPPADGAEPEAAATYHGKIVQVGESTLLLAAEDADDEGLCTVALADLALKDSQGRTLAAEDLTCAMVVEIGYNGEIMETYPAQLAQPKTLVVKAQEDDLVGLYLTVLDDLYAVDPGLNADVVQLAFDLEQVHNLSDSEKQALLYLAGQRLGHTTYAATFQDLLDQGVIDAEEPYFTDGLLITLKDEPLQGGRFTFQAQKWRSGLGAYYFTDCTALKRDGRWQYTIGAEAIS